MATALIGPLAWERPYATGYCHQKKKKKKEKEIFVIDFEKIQNLIWTTLFLHISEIVFLHAKNCKTNSKHWKYVQSISNFVLTKGFCKCCQMKYAFPNAARMTECILVRCVL